MSRCTIWTSRACRHADARQGQSAPNDEELDALLARRDRSLRYLWGLFNEFGEDKVLVPLSAVKTRRLQGARDLLPAGTSSFASPRIASGATRLRARGRGTLGGDLEGSLWRGIGAGGFSLSPSSSEVESLLFKT